LENCISTCRLIKLCPKKINSKWIRDLNVRPDILKLLDKKIGKTLHDTVIDNDFLNRTLVPQIIEARFDK
jgi:hypothetical protein